MTLLIKLTNGVPDGSPIVENNFRQLFSNVSFPSILTPAIVEPYGYGLYDFSIKPEQQKYKKIVETVPVKNQYGVWKQSWNLVDKTEQEKEEENENKKKEVRAQRTQLLLASDWTQVADSPVDKQAWALYRQSLRDVTLQSGFPWNVQWPTEP